MNAEDVGAGFDAGRMQVSIRVKEALEDTKLLT